MSIIQTLYESNQSAPTKKETEAVTKLLTYQDKVQAVFGYDFIKEMIDAQDNFDAANMSASYERGFTDCFQLWLEVFSRYSS